MMMGLFTKYKFILSVFLLTALSVANLSSYGIPPTHDGEYHIMRIWQFHKVLLDGNFTPLWAPDFNNGFGIPLFNFVYPLPNYIGSFFHWIGFSLIDSYKLTMSFGSFLGAIFMYLFIKQRWGRVSGLVASVFYTFAPYHLLDIYVRGSVGEILALGIFPGILWSYEKFMAKFKYRYFVVTSILLALLVLSHNILAIVFFPMFIVVELFLILSDRKKLEEIFQLTAVSIVGLGLSAPFWLPAIVEKKYVQGLQVSNPIDHFPVFYKLIYSSWGYGFSGITTEGQMSFQIGIAGVIVVLVSIFFSYFFKKIRREALFYLLLLSSIIFFITPYSTWFWDRLPLINFVQFPWRFLGGAIFIISLLAGLITNRSIYNNKIAFVLFSSFLVLLSVSFSFNYIKAPFYHERSDDHYLTRPNFTDGTNSPGDAFNTIWLNNVPKKEKNKIELIGVGQLKDFEIFGQKYKFTADLKEKSIVKINTAYFPFWKSIIDGEHGEVQNSSGIISLEVDKGLHRIEVFVGNTTLRMLSYLIFGLSILVLALLHKFPIGIINKKKNHENRN